MVVPRSVAQHRSRQRRTASAIARWGLALGVASSLMATTAFAEGCAPGVAEAPPQSQVPPARPVDCPRLDSQLYQLSQAQDPVAFAAGAGLDYRDGMTRVIVEAREGAVLPPSYGLVVEGRYLTLTEARAPVDRLCALANDPAVLSVRPAGGAEPQGASG